MARRDNAARASAHTAAGLGATIGLAVGVAAKMALAVSMLSIFVFMRLWGAVG